MATELTPWSSGDRMFDGRASSICHYEFMTSEERYAAEATYRAFLICTPDRPPSHKVYGSDLDCGGTHADFMAAARKRWPNLPPGAQQAALYTLHVDGPKAAAKYASNAAARWRVNAFRFTMPKRSNAGICTYSVAERDERLVRYRAAMAAGAEHLERERKKSQRKFDREMKKVDPSWIPGQSLVGFPKFNAALAATKGA